MVKRRERKPEVLAVGILEAARLLGIGERLTYKLIADGTLRVVKLGRRTIVPMESIHELLAGRRDAKRADEP